MENLNNILSPLRIGIFLSLFTMLNPFFGLYWNGNIPLSLPFVGQGVIRASLEIPMVTNIPLSFEYVSNLFVIQPVDVPKEKHILDGFLRIVYPWKEVSYQMRLVTIVPEISLLHIPQLGRGKSGLVMYRVKAEVPFQTWIVDNTGLKYYPYGHKGTWMVLVGWPLNASTYHLKVVVEDAAKNWVEKSIDIQPLKVGYRVRTIQLASDFSQRQAAEVNLTNLTGDPLKDYESLMREFARHTKVSIRELTYKRPLLGWQFFTNVPFLPLKEYELSSLFGDERRFFLQGKMIRNSYHHGVDFIAPSNSQIFSPWGGKVIFADYNGASGNTVVVDHGLGLHAIYMHLEKIDVKVGEMVLPNEPIGIIGRSGYSTGIHLHLGFSIQGRYVDPLDWTNKDWVETHILSPLKKYLHE